METTINSPNPQNYPVKYLDVPETAIRKIPTENNIQNNSQTAPSLLNTTGWSAAANGLFHAKPVWENRERAAAAKWLKDGKIYQKAKNIAPLLSAGKAIGNLGIGSATSAAITAPADWLSGKMGQKYQNDKQFNPAHFAAIATPAIISGTLGTGALMNSMDQMKNSGKIGTKKMVKNILSPKKILHATKKEMKNISHSFKGKHIGRGLLASALLGTSLIDPIQYIIRTKNNKKRAQDNNKKYIKKEASAKLKLGTKVSDYLARKRQLGIGLLALGTYVGVKKFIEDKRRDINNHADKVKSFRLRNTISNNSLYL